MIFAPEEQHVYSRKIKDLSRSARSAMLTGTCRSSGATNRVGERDYKHFAPTERTEFFRIYVTVFECY